MAVLEKVRLRVYHKATKLARPSERNHCLLSNGIGGALHPRGVCAP